MKKILFVCTGNTCRSPMAQGLCQKYISENMLVGVFGCASAGIDVHQGEAISENAAQVMNEIGVDMSSHRARMVTQEMVEQADYIFTMTPTQKSILTSMFPAEAEKVAVLGNPIFDPYGQNIDFYRFSRDSLEDKVHRAINGIIEDIERQKELDAEAQYKSQMYGGRFYG